MPLSNAAGNDLALLLFNNDTWAGIGDTTGIVGSGSPGYFYISLHTGSPGAGGNQTTNEANYVGYARIPVIRTTAGWLITGTTVVSNVASINFALCTGGVNVITHFGIGKVASGPGEIVVSDALTASLTVSAGIDPIFSIGAITVNVV